MGLVAMGVVTAGLATATSAQAIDVDVVQTGHGASGLFIYGWSPGERNDITLKPFGSVPDEESSSTEYPNAPLSVLVTDTATPITDVGGCIRVSANSARCLALNGIHQVDASLGNGSGSGDSFKLDPGSKGLKTPMFYVLQTGDHDDHVSIPASRGGMMWTLGGNDTIDVTAVAGGWGTLIRAGAGDDQIELKAPGAASVYCDDGIDTAHLLVPGGLFVDGCETVTGQP